MFLHYRMVGQLGKGAMGVVWRARDTALERDVAIKILPEVFAEDAERRIRFEREAKLLATINHTNVAAIYGLHLDHGRRFLAMELVEGEDLSQRLSRGALPIDEALIIAVQIARGLEQAHDHGVIHRDLKPANIRITPDDTAKVLDFGLAKGVTVGSNLGAVDSSYAATMTADTTAAGMIIGTAAYMSPEQARGKLVDKRADIWAFGCILYEMLVGRRAFEGDSFTELLAAVVTREPDWTRLPNSTPLYVVRLLKRCLRKDPAHRLRDLGDALLELEELDVAETPDTLANLASRAQVLRWSAITGLAAALVVFLLMWEPGAEEATAVGDPYAFAIPAPPGARLNRVAIAPNGRRAVYSAESDSGTAHLWLHELGTSDVRRLEDTENAEDPFWSPDSRYVGFFADKFLKKIEVRTETVEDICPAKIERGGTWNEDGTIVFGGGAGGLLRVSAGGGVPRETTTLDRDRGENQQRFPSFLPDGEHVLYYSRNAVEADRAGLWLASIESGESRRLADALSSAVYADPGYLLYRRDDRLVAHRFDTETLELSGEPELVADSLWFDPTQTALTSFSVSRNGILLYRTGGQEKSDLAWFDRAGNHAGDVPWGANSYVAVALSRSGDQILASIPSTGVDRCVSTYDLRTGLRTQLTFSGDAAGTALFSPDGMRAMMTMYLDEKFGLFEMDLVSGSLEARLTEEYPSVTDWVDEDTVVYQKPSPGDYALHVLNLSNGDNDPFRTRAVNTMFGAVSPDGRWIAYTSNHTGRTEVYVESFPLGGQPWQVSRDGGHQPNWHPDGSELFFLAPDRYLMAAENLTGDARTFQWGKPTPLFKTDVMDLGPRMVCRTFAIGPDDEKRFLIITRRKQDATPAVAVLNWTSRLEGR